MYGLYEQFGDRVDFVLLDTTLEETREARYRFEMFRRSTYVLIDAEGNRLGMWIGPLDADAMAAEIKDLLASPD